LVGIPYKILSSPNHIYLFDLGVFRYFGVVPIVVGAIIYFWCSYNFVFFGKGTPIVSMPPKELVVKGLYKFVRNPMYIAGFLVLAGEALLFQSKGLFIYFLVMFGIINIMVLAFEEPHLEKRFGGSYKRYRKSVPRWIPRSTPYQKNDSASQ
jgi:protein-S-isoprenylcysteine O-methyltransferase Ste14